jgi:hypothetical protein
VSDQMINHIIMFGLVKDQMERHISSGRLNSRIIGQVRFFDELKFLFAYILSYLDYLSSGFNKIQAQ